jgi:di/tricarboxylate transporter
MPPANFLNMVDIIVRAALLACDLKEEKPISIWDVLLVLGGGIALAAFLSQDKYLDLSKLIKRVFGLGTTSESGKRRRHRK